MFSFKDKVDISFVDDLTKRLSGEAEGKAGVMQANMVTRAKVNEFGNPDNIFFGNPKIKAPIPERPFIRPAIEGRRNVRDYENAMAEQIIGDLDTVDLDSLLTVLGEAVKEKIQLNIIDKSEPRNAEFTVNRKGFDDPLIETGGLFDSIDWDVVKGQT